jgi:hypothetical protein
MTKASMKLPENKFSTSLFPRSNDPADPKKRAEILAKWMDKHNMHVDVTEELSKSKLQPSEILVMLADGLIKKYAREHPEYSAPRQFLDQPTERQIFIKWALGKMIRVCAKAVDQQAEHVSTSDNSY